MMDEHGAETARIDRDFIRTRGLGARRSPRAKTRLMNIQRGGGNSKGLQVQDEKRNRAQFAGGPQQIERGGFG